VMTRESGAAIGRPLKGGDDDDQSFCSSPVGVIRIGLGHTRHTRSLGAGEMRLVSSQAKGRTRARAPASVRPDSDL
jgi:hypothetical protein